MNKTIEKQHVRAYEAPVCEMIPLQMQGVLAGGGESGGHHPWGGSGNDGGSNGIEP